VSGGRSDAVIIKDLTNASNCVVTGPNAALANAYVNAFNSGLGLRPTVPVPGANTTGAYSVRFELDHRPVCDGPELRPVHQHLHA
jgi:hypothetical protein